MKKTISWTMKSYTGQAPGTIVAKTRVTVARAGGSVSPFQEVASTVTSVDYDFTPDIDYVVTVESVDPNGNLIPGVAATPTNYRLASITVQGPGGISIS